MINHSNIKIWLKRYSSWNYHESLFWNYSNLFFYSVVLLWIVCPYKNHILSQSSWSPVLVLYKKGQYDPSDFCLRSKNLIWMRIAEPVFNKITDINNIALYHQKWWSGKISIFNNLPDQWMLICLDENFQDRENCDVECITRIAKTGHTTHHSGSSFLLKSFHCHFDPLTILFERKYDE